MADEPTENPSSVPDLPATLKRICSEHRSAALVATGPISGQRERMSWVIPLRARFSVGSSAICGAPRDRKGITQLIRSRCPEIGPVATSAALRCSEQMRFRVFRWVHRPFAVLRETVSHRDCEPLQEVRSIDALYPLSLSRNRTSCHERRTPVLGANALQSSR
jgi:hypothetical protein